jgi:hypothetical protein
MSDTVQSTREYSLEFEDKSTLEVEISIAISTENQNSIASLKLENFPLVSTIEALNKAIVEQIHSDGDSDDDEIELESIGLDQEDGE